MVLRGETTLEVMRHSTPSVNDESADEEEGEDYWSEVPEASMLHWRVVFGPDPSLWALPWHNCRGNKPAGMEEEEEERLPEIELHDFTPLKFHAEKEEQRDQMTPMAGVLWEGVDEEEGPPLSFPTETPSVPEVA